MQPTTIPRPARTTRRVLAAVALTVAVALVAPPTAGAGPIDTVDVAMVDNRFDPRSVVVPIGRGVTFQNFGGVVHDAQDDTGLDLFATDILGSLDTEAIAPLPGAGRFRYVCTFHPGMTGYLQVPVRPAAGQGSVGEAVALRWAPARAEAGLVFDVQRRRPGADAFVTWRSGTTAAGASFRPDRAGTWSLRARVRAASGATSDWSPPRTVQVD